MTDDPRMRRRTWSVIFSFCEGEDLEWGGVGFLLYFVVVTFLGLLCSTTSDGVFDCTHLLGGPDHIIHGLAPHLLLLLLHLLLPIWSASVPVRVVVWVSGEMSEGFLR